MPSFNAFSVLLTENCNLACKYCYEVTSTGHKNNYMTEKVALDVVDFMFDHAADEPEIMVSLFGGEPTIMPDIIDVICTRGKELSRTHNKPFKVGMITNATVMNEKLYNILRKHRDVWVSTQLSVDGPWDIQDEYRVTKSGKGTFGTIEKNLPYWKSLYGSLLSVHGVLNQKSIPRLFESYKYFKDNWDEHRLWFLPAKSADLSQKDVDAYDIEMGKIYDFVMDDVRKTGSLDEVEFYAPLDRSLRNGRSPKPCGAGDNYCTITSSGEIWPCHHFYFVDTERQLYLGNIYDGVDFERKRIWEDYDNDDIIGCDGCEHDACFRCMAENFDVNGNPFIQITDNHCDFMMVDFKYQTRIKKELVEMGLIDNPVDCGCVSGQPKSDDNGIQNFTDIVGELVTRPEESVKESVKESGGCGGCKGCGPTEPEEEIVDVGNKQLDSKQFLGDIMEVILKHYGRL